MVLRVVPASEVDWLDLAAVFGSRGSAARCWCQRYKLARGESFARLGPEVLAERLRWDVGCDDPGRAGTGVGTAGLVGWLDSDAVAWVAVQPRPAYAGLTRVTQVPWEGREEDRTDASVWAITCLLVRAGFRRQGLSRELAVAAVAHARAEGARAVEAYPLVGSGAIDEERHVGTRSTFASAGLVEVARPTPRRSVMRLDLEP